MSGGIDLCLCVAALHLTLSVEREMDRVRKVRLIIYHYCDSNSMLHMQQQYFQVNNYTYVTPTSLITFFYFSLVLLVSVLITVNYCLCKKKMKTQKM